MSCGVEHGDTSRGPDGVKEDSDHPAEDFQGPWGPWPCGAGFGFVCVFSARSRWQDPLPARRTPRRSSRRTTADSRQPTAPASLQATCSGAGPRAALAGPRPGLGRWGWGRRDRDRPRPALCASEGMRASCFCVKRRAAIRCSGARGRGGGDSRRAPGLPLV